MCAVAPLTRPTLAARHRYLRALCAAGVPQHLVEEHRSLSRTSFEYAGPRSVVTLPMSA